MGQGESEQTIASAIGGVLVYDYQIHGWVITKSTAVTDFSGARTAGRFSDEPLTNHTSSVSVSSEASSVISASCSMANISFLLDTLALSLDCA